MIEIGKYFAISMPFFLIAVLGEKLYGYLKKNDTVPFMDTISSGYSGITMMWSQLLGLSIIVFPYSLLVEKFSLFQINATWLNYCIAFVALDFSFYWGHRLHHQINYFWNSHLIHHSSEEFNLACALRQTISNMFVVFTIFLIPAAILGVPAKIMFFITPIHQLLQYWYHTRHIGKLGFLEHIIVTPSHHRVHHAMNPIYIDKNHSAIFIIWDKLFGTFQEELDTEPPVYGITRPAQTYNPILINFQHLALLIKDAWRAEKWTDKFTIWFRPTGWRPEGFEEKYPVKKIDDVFHFEKFNPSASSGLIFWNIVQFFFIYLMSIYAFFNASHIGINNLFIFAAFIFVQIYSATEMMNRNKWAPMFSVICIIVSLGIYFYDTTFFGLHNISESLVLTILLYFVFQAIATYLFHIETDKQNIATV